MKHFCDYITPLVKLINIFTFPLKQLSNQFWTPGSDKKKKNLKPWGKHFSDLHTSQGQKFIPKRDLFTSINIFEHYEQEFWNLKNSNVQNSTKKIFDKSKKFKKF